MAFFRLANTTLGFTSDGHGVVRTLISTLGRRRHEPRRSRRFCVGGRRVGSVVTTMIDDDRAVEGQTKGDIYGQFRTLSRRVSGREKIRQTRDYFTAPRRLPKVRDRGWMEFSARARRAISTSVRRTRVAAGRRVLATHETRQSVRCEYHKLINRRSSRARSRTSSTRVSRQTTTKSLCLESALEHSKPWRCSPSPLANFQTRRPSSHWWRTCHHGGRVEGS